MFSIENLIERLRTGKRARQRFVESHLAKAVAYQIRALRDESRMSQEELAAAVGMNQNGISRLESPEYGKPTLTTLKRIAAAFDVALIVRFVPFSQLTKWVGGVPQTIPGLSWEALSVPSFEAEEREGRLEALLSLEKGEDDLLFVKSFHPSGVEAFGAQLQQAQQRQEESKVFNINDYKRITASPTEAQAI